MGCYFCVYGNNGDILSVCAFERATRDEADKAARNPPKSSNITIGTEVLVVEISNDEYKKLNEMFDFVESNPRLKDDFMCGLKGVVAAIKDGTVYKGGVLNGFNGVSLMLEIYSEYKLPNVVTSEMLSLRVNKIKADRLKTRNKLKKDFMDILIREYTKKLRLVKDHPHAVIFT